MIDFKLEFIKIYATVHCTYLYNIIQEHDWTTQGESVLVLFAQNQYKACVRSAIYIAGLERLTEALSTFIQQQRF